MKITFKKSFTASVVREGKIKNVAFDGNQTHSIKSIKYGLNTADIIFADGLKLDGVATNLLLSVDASSAEEFEEVEEITSEKLTEVNSEDNPEEIKKVFNTESESEPDAESEAEEENSSDSQSTKKPSAKKSKKASQ